MRKCRHSIEGAVVLQLRSRVCLYSDGILFLCGKGEGQPAGLASIRTVKEIRMGIHFEVSHAGLRLYAIRILCRWVSVQHSQGPRARRVMEARVRNTAIRPMAGIAGGMVGVFGRRFLIFQQRGTLCVLRLHSGSGADLARECGGVELLQQRAFLVNGHKVPAFALRNCLARATAALGVFDWRLGLRSENSALVEPFLSDRTLLLAFIGFLLLLLVFFTAVFRVRIFGRFLRFFL